MSVRLIAEAIDVLERNFTQGLVDLPLPIRSRSQNRDHGSVH
jgi:hypothetical protein